MATSVELFAGAGGLAIGLSRAGFRHVAVIERDSAACETIRMNIRAGIERLADWPLVEADIEPFDFGGLGKVDLLAGGPPCQPFAISGSRRAHGDKRNMFPAMVRAIRELSPEAVLIENVAGLTRGRLRSYFEYILLQLTVPYADKEPGESWSSHFLRLRMRNPGLRANGSCYHVHATVLQAADFGVPQRRERVFIVAFKSSLGPSWKFPSPTHSFDRLLWDQWISGEYWDLHEVPRRLRPFMERRYRARVERLKSGPRPVLERWQTVRDALVGLPKPALSPSKLGFPNHVFVPGARLYEGHTGSPLDMPAKTLKAGAHGVPGGENIVVYPNREIRYFTIRECARLQTFPDEYVFVGNWKSLVRQVGNAVPVRIVELIGLAMRRRLANADRSTATA